MRTTPSAKELTRGLNARASIDRHSVPDDEDDVTPWDAVPSSVWVN